MKNQKKVKSLILQRGEGVHVHVLNAKGNSSIEVKPQKALDNIEDAFEFLLSGTGVVTHEEHDRIVLDKGTVIKYPQQEYDPFNQVMRNVYD